MRRNILSILILLILLISCTNNTQVTETPNKTVVFELFSANWCTNCPNAEFALDKLAKNDSIVAIVYHPTTNDTFGTAETNARFDYYNLTTSQTPVAMIDGKIKIMGAEDTTIYNSYFNVFMSEDSLHVPVEIAIDTFNIRDSIIYAGIHFNNVDTTGINYTVRYLIIENNIRYTGSNGETLHQYVARDFLETENGYNLNISPKGFKDTTIQIKSEFLHPEMYGSFIVLVQDDNSKEIIQSIQKEFSISPDTTFLSIDAPLIDTQSISTEEYIHIIINNTKNDSIYSMQVSIAPFADTITDWVNCAFGLCYLSDTNGIIFPTHTDTIPIGDKDTVELHIEYGSDDGEGQYTFRIKKSGDLAYTDSLVIKRVAQ